MRSRHSTFSQFLTSPVDLHEAQEIEVFIPSPPSQMSFLGITST